MATTQVTDTTEVTLSSLPISIQNQIPYSLRSRKDTYLYSKLPKNIQYLVKDYLESEKSIEYSTLYDTKPSITSKGDFEVIDNYFDLVIEYLKNYLMLTKGQYPFDPSFYSKLKYYIQTKDTSTRYTLINNEVHRIANILSMDLSIPVQILNLNIESTNVSGASVTYHITMTVQVNNQSKDLLVDVT